MSAETGKRFPDFSLQNQDGKTVTLDDFKGKWLVLYVYPKDDTPGCTIQGKSFTATKQEFDDANIAGVGQSDYKGTMYWNRTSFVMDPEGVLRKVYEKVNPEGHERVLLEDIKAMQ